MNRRSYHSDKFPCEGIQFAEIILKSGSAIFKQGIEELIPWVKRMIYYAGFW